MSFWSSLVLARAAQPPVVTTGAIGTFLRNLAATGALVEGEEPLCQIKYGSHVDTDKRTTDMIEWDESGVIGTVGEYPWDVSDTFPSIAAMADRLELDGRSVYRAHLSLGQLHPDIVAALTRKPSEENQIELCLSEASFKVEPAHLWAGWGWRSQGRVTSILGPTGRRGSELRRSGWLAGLERYAAQCCLCHPNA